MKRVSVVFCLLFACSVSAWGAFPKNLVPDVVGMQESAAVSALTSAGLTLGETVQHCSDAPVGAVIATIPDVGEDIPAGSAVVLVISTEIPCFAAVPDLTGQTEAAGNAALLSAGLAAGTVVNGCSNSAPAGTIIGQCPLPGTLVSPGTEVSYMVSTGVCPPQPLVPNVVGMQQSAAAQAIQDATLTVGTVAQSCSSLAPGTVILQFPPAGVSVSPGTSVYLLVSSGPCQSQVAAPNCVGSTQSAATAAIVSAGLTVGAISEQCSDSVPAGQVISQNPAPGSAVDPLTPVHLVVSSGACPPIAVPDVVGALYNDAVAQITVSFNVGSVTYVCSDTVASGRVLSQNPPAQTLAQPYSQVDLVVSSGPCPVPVPNVVGLAQAAAAASIQQAGLAVGSVSQQCSATVPAGNVIAQSPGAGAQVAPGSAVSISVSTGPCPADVAVPDVVGLAQAAAAASIQQAGLAVGSVSQQCSSSVPAGNVIAQSPGAGAQVPPGSSVSLTVSTGDCPTDAVVPDVVGLSRTEAAARLQGSNLAIGSVSEQCSNSVPAGVVLAQSLPPGTAVVSGTSVGVTVSSGICDLASILDDLRQNFDRYDTNQDGMLDITEIRAIYPAFSDANFVTANADATGGISAVDLAPADGGGFDLAGLLADIGAWFGGAWGRIIAVILLVLGLIAGLFYLQCETC